MAYRVAYVMDQRTLADRPMAVRRVALVRDIVRRLHADHLRHTPLVPFDCELLYERESHDPAAHKLVVDMDGFAWNDRKRAERRMQIMLDGLTRIHLDHFQRYPKTPSLYASGVRYEREPPGQEDWQDIFTTLRRRSGDCEDLATWRAADLLRRGIRARAFGRPRPMLIQSPTGAEMGTLWHILVRWPNGKIEDPSKLLGMQGAA